MRLSFEEALDNKAMQGKAKVKRLKRVPGKECDSASDEQRTKH